MKCIQCNKNFDGRSIQKYCSTKCRETFWNRKSYKNHRLERLEKQKSPEYKKKQNEYNKKPERREKRKNYLRLKRKSDPLFRLKYSIVDRLRHELRFKSSFKLKNLENYLGYSIKDLWNNLLIKKSYHDLYLKRKLELDHIIPYNWFIVLKLGDGEFKKCWSIKNLRLIPRILNIKRPRKSTINWKDIKKYELQEILPKGMNEIWNENKKEF